MLMVFSLDFAPHSACIGKPPPARQREETIREIGKEGQHSGCTADRGRVGGDSSKEEAMFVVSFNDDLCFYPLLLVRVPYNILYSTASHNIYFNVYQGRKINNYIMNY
jgi:hypothetical protein